MSFSFSSLIRLIAFLSVGATMVAVGLARVEDPSSGRRTRQRPNKIHINELYVRDLGRNPHWLDIESGRIDSMPLAPGDVLETASCAPWTDEKGRGQVVGRWSARTQEGPRSTTTDFGLARYAFPKGELLDHVSTDIMPIAPPTWYPGTRARVLYAAGDGRLYHHAFEKDRGSRGETGPGGDSAPRPLAWRCRPPGLGEVYVSDVRWVDDPRIVDRVVVTLRLQLLDGRGVRAYSRNQLWWLRLDRAGTTIVEAGRLIADDPDDHDERSATIATLPDGRLVASYLRQQGIARPWQLRVAPIRIEPGRRAPEIAWSTTRVLADDCLPSPLAFSPDGRYLAAMVGKSITESRPTRISTAPILFPGPPTLLAGPVPAGP